MVDSTVLMKAMLLIIYYILYSLRLSIKKPMHVCYYLTTKFLFVFKFVMDVFNNRNASFFPAFPGLTPISFYCLKTFSTLLQQGEMWNMALQKQINK